MATYLLDPETGKKTLIHRTRMVGTEDLPVDKDEPAEDSADFEDDNGEE
jgi:hypothetical protein